MLTRLRRRARRGQVPGSRPHPAPRDFRQDQGGERLYSYECGSSFLFSIKELWSVTFTLQGDDDYRPFPYLDRLIDGLSGVAAQLTSQTVLGEPFDNAYGNDRYALENGAELDPDAHTP